MKECRICDRVFGSLQLFDAHLGSDAELVRGQRSRILGIPSTEGHHDPKGGTRDQNGVWRLPGSSWTTATPADGLLAGLADYTEPRLVPVSAWRKAPPEKRYTREDYLKDKARRETAKGEETP